MNWETLLKPEYEQGYFKSLKRFLSDEAKRGIKVYPKKDEILAAFRETPFEKTKVVILGQDPYHGPNQAHGLAFSVQKGVDIPPSLKNIFKELHDDLGVEIPSHGNLTAWARQGVLLLNTVLTVRASEAHAHAKQGWEVFTDKAIRVLNAQSPEPVVFMLWGAPAGRKAELIDSKRHLVLKAAHPSPLSCYRGFYGCKHFSKANAFLEEIGRGAVDWRIPD